MFTHSTVDLETAIWLKCRLLVEGCSIDQTVRFPEWIHQKKIHLYAHSTESTSNKIPDDLLIGDGESQVICRIRYREKASLQITQKENNYFLFDKEDGQLIPISFPEGPKYEQASVQGHPLSSICSSLGRDLLGITPSNYCFYFKDGKQCRFCEIFPTYQDKVEYPKALKDVPLICEAIQKAMALDERLSHIAVTSGNIRSYDYTFEYFISIGEKLLELGLDNQGGDVLATLMPPDQPHLIERLSQTFFNKIYFPIEVYEYEHFVRVCPGKAEYGYHKIMERLALAKEVFGKGNAYTNLVYGVQSLNQKLDPFSYCPLKENEKGLIAVDQFLRMGIIPAFTLYHFSGYNQIGNIELNSLATYEFFKKWGEKVYESQIVPKEKNSMLFNSHSLSNTLINDVFRMAKGKREC